MNRMTRTARPPLRWARLFLGLLTVLLLVGCQGEVTPTAFPTPIPTPTSPPLPPGAPVPARILSRHVLVVGVRYDLPPFGYVTEDGEVTGFDVALGRELASRWLGDPDAVLFRQVRSDTAAQHILAGDVDLTLTALPHTQDAEAQVDFGPRLFDDGYALLVNSTDALTITAPSDLEGVPVGVVSGSGASAALRATVPFTPTFFTYETFDQALEALARGEVRGVSDLRRRLVRGLQDVPGTVIAGQFSHIPLAPAFGPNEPGMGDLVNLTLQEMFVAGDFYDLYTRWFTGDSAPTAEVWPGRAMVTPEEAASATSVSSTIANIQARGRLRVAMVSDRSPFAYLDAAGDPAGYEVHLMRLIADRWLGDRTAVDFLPVPLDDGLRMVTSGGADLLIGAVPHTREAERQADFGLTIYVAGEGLMVRAGTTVDDVTALDGQQVAAVAGTGSSDTLQQVAQVAQVSLVILTKPTLEDALAALESGEVVAVVGDRADLLGPAYATPGIGVTADRLTRVPLAFALPPGDSSFRDLVNLTLQAMDREGTLNAVYEQWFDDGPFELEEWPGESGVLLRIAVP